MLIIKIKWSNECIGFYKNMKLHLNELLHDMLVWIWNVYQKSKWTMLSPQLGDIIRWLKIWTLGSVFSLLGYGTHSWNGWGCTLTLLNTGFIHHYFSECCAMLTQGVQEVDTTRQKLQLQNYEPKQAFPVYLLILSCIQSSY